MGVSSPISWVGEGAFPRPSPARKCQAPSVGNGARFATPVTASGCLSGELQAEPPGRGRRVARLGCLGRGQMKFILRPFGDTEFTKLGLPGGKGDGQTARTWGHPGPAQTAALPGRPGSWGRPALRISPESLMPAWSCTIVVGRGKGGGCQLGSGQQAGPSPASLSKKGRQASRAGASPVTRGVDQPGVLTPSPGPCSRGMIAGQQAGGWTPAQWRDR